MRVSICIGSACHLKGSREVIQKLQKLNEQQFKGLELEWHKPEEDAGK